MPGLHSPATQLVAWLRKPHGWLQVPQFATSTCRFRQRPSPGQHVQPVGALGGRGVGGRTERNASRHRAERRPRRRQGSPVASHLVKSGAVVRSSPCSSCKGAGSGRRSDQSDRGASGRTRRRTLLPSRAVEAGLCSSVDVTHSTQRPALVGAAPPRPALAPARRLRRSYAPAAAPAGGAFAARAAAGSARRAGSVVANPGPERNPRNRHC